ncbi:MAG: hypothetical protein HYS23_04395 [Geobacter sp.]|nr:hypothetical protein [Geobacter sp.]
MNKKQKKVLIAAFAIVILMGLIPPYSAQIPIYDSSNYTTEDLGYSFIFDPAPTSAKPVRGNFISGSIDFGKLFLQWLIVGITASGLYFFMRNPDEREKTED